MIEQLPQLPTLHQLLTEPGRPLIHRDLSWLQFNERVLSEARNNDTPLLERIKFLAISASNLDEFFMIRFASLRSSISQARRQGQAEREEALIRIRDNILKTVGEFTFKQAATLELLQKQLLQNKIQIVTKLKLDDQLVPEARAIFETEILPHIGHPREHGLHRLGQLENLQMGYVFSSGMFIPIPRSLPQVFVNDQNSKRIKAFVLDELLMRFLPELFGTKETLGALRLTRDGDIPIELENDDYGSIPDRVRSSLSSREKGRPVRLQYRGEIFDHLLGEVLNFFKLEPQQSFPAPHSLSISGLWTLVKATADRPSCKKLVYAPLRPFVPPVFKKKESLFEKLKEKDLIFHHPYDSFDAYVEWIRIASEDPQVEVIQQTVYRMDALSPVIDLLQKAAKKKKVRVVIELRARFDELHNLSLAEKLRSAGVEVAFGFGRLKIHAKLALVTRREGGELVHYTHLSTGNYNATTARQYEDLAILTANPDFGTDAMHFFDSVFSRKVPSAFRKLVSAPRDLHRRLQALIESETRAASEGRPARIVAKVNALVDEGMIEKLYQASQAGVQIDLIVRGACSLVPGVPGLSENIRVMSVIDRFLEHSRIYYFEHSRALFLSSADWMPRNFFSRLELAFPVVDPSVFDFISKIVIGAYLSDVGRSKKLLPQGVWKKRSSSDVDKKTFSLIEKLTENKSVRVQFFFAELTNKKYKNTTL